MSRVISMLNLAYRFNLHMIRKPLSAARESARRRFLGYYSPDQLYPLSVEQRRPLSRFNRCICCGLCDTVCANLRAAPRQHFSGPSDLASCLSRNLPAYDLLEDYLRDWQACGDCRACEAVCPSGMPLRELAAFVEEFRRNSVS